MFCETCPARRYCGAYRTADACGLRDHYRPGPVHAKDLTPGAATELEFSPVSWPDIPPLGPALCILDRAIPSKIVGIRLRNILRVPAQDDHQNLNQQVAILLGKDDLLERLWNRQYSVARSLAAWHVSLVVAPGYSTWWNDPPSESLVSMARSAEVARVLAQHLPTVPCVVWRHPDPDIERWAQWLNDSKCPAIAVDLQTHRGKLVWRWGIYGVEKLAATLNHPLPRILVNGPSSVARIRDVGAAWPGPITVMSSNPWQKATHGFVLDEDLIGHKAPELSVRELLDINMKRYEHAAARIILDRKRPSDSAALSAA